MKILLVEPFGRWVGHLSQHAKHLSDAYTNIGLDVTLVTFDGVLGDWTEKDSEIKHISFCSKVGLFAYPLRWLQTLRHLTVFMGLIGSINPNYARHI